MTKLKSRFEDYLQKTIDRNTAYLKEQNWLDRVTNGPDVAPIRAMLGPQNQASPEPAEQVLQGSYWVGAAYEYMGHLKTALAWYQLGQSLWRTGKSFEHWEKDRQNMELVHRSIPVLMQLPAAICAERVGETSRARDLYAWSVENSTFTQQEKDFYTKHKSYQTFWSRYPGLAYALCCLERWDEAFAVAEEAYQWVQKDRRAQTTESYQSPLRILPVVLALARYKVIPTTENRRAAQDMLNPQVVASHSHTAHLLTLFHLFNLRARHPELANPPDEELPFAERVQQANRACRQFMAQGGFHLDGTPESLKLLDQHMRNIYDLSADQERQKMLIMFWGSYFGEVVRRELAGGQWKFEKELLEASLEWQIGEVKLNLWAYEYVLGYLQGQVEKSLYQLWQETEQAYIDYGLAAKYAD